MKKRKILVVSLLTILLVLEFSTVAFASSTPYLKSMTGAGRTTNQDQYMQTYTTDFTFNVSNIILDSVFNRPAIATVKSTITCQNLQYLGEVKNLTIVIYDTMASLYEVNVFNGEKTITGTAYGTVKYGDTVLPGMAMVTFSGVDGESDGFAFYIIYSSVVLESVPGGWIYGKVTSKVSR